MPIHVNQEKGDRNQTDALRRAIGILGRAGWYLSRTPTTNLAGSIMVAGSCISAAGIEAANIGLDENGASSDRRHH